MYCEECGAKAKEGANYCEECGAALKKIKSGQKIKKNLKLPSKKLSKKTKIIISVVMALILVITVLLLAANSITKPEEVVKDYFSALKNNNVDKIYSYLNVPDKEFTSKKVFKKLMKDEEKIINYAVTNTTVSPDGLEARVDVKYVTENNKTDTVTINLIKDGKKQMLFFPTWKMEDDTDLVSNYKIKVMKGSKVSLAGVSLTKKYLNEEESSDEVDVYEIPLLFKKDYPAKVVYPMGVTTNMLVNVDSFFNADTLDFSLDDLSDKDKENIEKAILKNIQYIYDSALADKSYDGIKNKLAKDEDLEETYNDFKENLQKRSADLASIKFTKVNLNRANVTDDGALNVSFKINYDYENDNDKNDDSSYASITFIYNDGYQVIDFNNFKTYF